MTASGSKQQFNENRPKVGFVPKAVVNDQILESRFRPEAIVNGQILVD